MSPNRSNWGKDTRIKDFEAHLITFKILSASVNDANNKYVYSSISRNGRVKTLAVFFRDEKDIQKLYDGQSITVKGEMSDAGDHINIHNAIIVACQ